MLAWLWTRLSDGGAQVTVSGRALRRFPDREVQRLLRARVLIEQRKADSWAVCAQCDCGLDARPIRQVGAQLRACCPHETAEDVILTEEDLRNFGLDAGRLAAEIAATGALSGVTACIAEGLWALGVSPAGTAVVLCSDPAVLDSLGAILAIRASVGARPICVVASEPDLAWGLRLRDAGLQVLSLADAFSRDTDGCDKLAMGSLAHMSPDDAAMPQTRSEDGARLQISRGRRTLRLDGRDIVLSLTAFDAFLGAAEKVVSGEVMLTYQELHALTRRASHRDVINEIRDQLERHGLSREAAFALVRTVHGRGLTIGVPAQDIRIRD